MPRHTDAVLMSQLKKEMCPGGAGHAGVTRFKAGCVLCRTQAELSQGVTQPTPPAPTAPWSRTVPGPGDRKR
jgi:hypothetical protein